MDIIHIIHMEQPQSQMESAGRHKENDGVIVNANSNNNNEEEEEPQPHQQVLPDRTYSTLAVAVAARNERTNHDMSLLSRYQPSVVNFVNYCNDCEGTKPHRSMHACWP
jgi:hypothetical protein